jgi:hypothetical protein
MYGVPGGSKQTVTYRTEASDIYVNTPPAGGTKEKDIIEIQRF